MLFGSFPFQSKKIRWYETPVDIIVDFTVLECSIFTIFDHKIGFKFFGTVKVTKALAGFERMTYL